MAKPKVRERRLRKLLISCLGDNAHRASSQLLHWEKFKGTEWTATRMKKMYQAALLVLNGSFSQAELLLRASGIATRKDRPWAPRGPWGNLFLDLPRIKSHASLRRKLAGLRCYTGLYLPVASKAQIRKARGCITGPGSGCCSNVHLRTPRMVEDHLGPLSLEGLSGSSRYFSGRFHIPGKEHLKRPFASMVLSLRVCGSVPPSVVDLLGDNALRRGAQKFQDQENIPGFGKIVFLQEGGAKGRVICLPSAWMQVYFRPLHNLLMRLVKSVESSTMEFGASCVLDQNKGAYLIKRWISEGRSTWCFDLRSATDRFPRSLQIEFLRKVGLGHWVKPLEEACEGKYWVPSARTYWSYSVGQPMGLAGSFPLFHLTHYSLLHEIAENYRARDCFAVLGDDVVISHKGVAEEYRRTILSLGVELSEEKSYGGGDLTEFAGFLATRRPDGSVAVFRPFKCNLGFDFAGLEVNLVHALGKAVRKWGTWWSKRLDLFRWSRPWRNPDLSPMIPEVEKLGTNFGVPTSRWHCAQALCLSRDPQLVRPYCGVDFSEVEYWALRRLAQVNDLAGPEIDTFSPEQYQEKEYLRKRNQFKSDRLISALLTSGIH